MLNEQNRYINLAFIIDENMYMNVIQVKFTRTHKIITLTRMKIICTKCKLGKDTQIHANQ